MQKQFDVVAFLNRVSIPLENQRLICSVYDFLNCYALIMHADLSLSSQQALADADQKFNVLNKRSLKVTD